MGRAELGLACRAGATRASKWVEDARGRFVEQRGRGAGCAGGKRPGVTKTRHVVTGGLVAGSWWVVVKVCEGLARGLVRRGMPSRAGKAGADGGMARVVAV